MNSTGPTKPHYVVGVGASAGGLRALEALFRNMPLATGASFIVLQHMSADFESRLDELIGRQTRLPVVKIENEAPLEPDTVYLSPPGKEMIVQGGRLLLTDKDPSEGFTLPIDRFLRSLAHDVGPRAVAVILSGSGSDGSRGIEDVHAAGGLVICQNAESARFLGMPTAALQTGVVDHVLAPEEIPDVLVEYVSRPLDPNIGKEPTPPGLEEVFRLVRKEFGLDFSLYKPSTVSRRLHRRLADHRIGDVEEYARYLATHPEEVATLYRDMLIGVTRFFRDREAFDVLEREVLPAMIANAGVNDHIRIWDAACATGEETYSLAIAVQEAIEKAGKPLSAKIFATDVHRQSLEFAGQGRFPEEALTEVEPELREKYFLVEGSEYRVKADLRRGIVFAPHNVLTDAPFTRLDLVVCRNLLIYLRPAAQKKVLSLFHFGLRTNGFLFLGPSETPGELGEEFEQVDKRWRMFRKRRDVRLATDLRVPMSPLEHRFPRQRPLDGLEALTMTTYDALLERFVPPSFLVDESYRLLHTFAGAERFLRVPGGRPTSNLLQLVSEELKTPVSGALRQAQKQRGPVRYTNITVGAGDRTQACQLSVTPLHNNRADTTHFLVALEISEAPVRSAGEMRELEPSEASKDYVESLESELRTTQENLQATIEELETSNEELQATNEELVASNEELQSTNEELHSVNEELYSVNAEHQRKIEELTELTQDMDNLLQSTDVGVVFLDGELKLRRFTARAATIFRLLPQDLGRDFEDFVHNVGDQELARDIEEVLHNDGTIEREVETRRGDYLLLRVLPYRAHGQTGGVVMTLVDIGTLKRTEANVARLSSIVEHSNDAIIGLSLDGVITAWNRGATRLYRWETKDALGRSITMLCPSDSVHGTLRMLQDDAAHRGEIQTIESTCLRKDGLRLEISRTVSPIRSPGGRLIGVSFIDRDITEQKQAEREIRSAAELRDRFLAMLSHELRNPLAAMLGATRLFQEGAPEEHKHAVSVLERQTKHVARLLDDLLDVSRLQRDGIEMRKQLIDLRSTVKSAIEIAQSKLAEKHIELATRIEDQPIWVSADPTRITQLQVNLLTNAAKYSDDGSRVDLEVTRRDGHARIRVIDEGRGIESDMLGRIFEPFVRAADPYSAREGGMGLGLSLVRSIAQAHGGSVSADSEGIGRGSRFTVELPVASATNGSTKPTPHQTTVATSTGGLVLLVEDNEDARYLMATILRRRGWRIVEAGDVESARNHMNGTRFHAAVVDIGLPDASGLVLGRALRDHYGSRIFIVAVTGWGRQEDRDRVLAAGFDEHLVKPVDAELVDRLLRERCRAPDPD